MGFRRVALQIAYDGREYSGWQTQPVDRTIQGTIEKSFGSLVGKQVRLTGAGRTDAGVSAWGQVAHADLSWDFPIPIGRLPGILNTRLPTNIRCLAAKEVANDFHARHSALGKIYKYTFRILPDFLFHHPLADPLSAPIRSTFNFSKAFEAGNFFLGRHDFRNFSVTSSLPDDPVRLISGLFWDSFPGGVALWITGPGFLHRMVRMIGGILKEVGEGRRSPSEIPDLLLPGAPPPFRPIEPLPPEGLALVRVLYGKRDPFDPRSQNWYALPEATDSSSNERLS